MLKALYTYVTTEMWEQIHPTTVMVIGFAMMVVIVGAAKLWPTNPNK